MAKLPIDLVQKSEKSLGDLAIGESGFILPEELVVARDMECFLRPGAKVKLESTFSYSLSVTRDATGFHVTVRNGWKWNTNAPFLMTFLMTIGYLKVASITVDPDPNLVP